MTIRKFFMLFSAFFTISMSMGMKDPNKGKSPELNSKINIEEYRNIDLYALLNVSSGCETRELTVQYRKLAKQLHPDRYKGMSETEKADAEERCKLINAAYTVLSDIDARGRYDRLRSTSSNFSFSSNYYSSNNSHSTKNKFEKNKLAEMRFKQDLKEMCQKKDLDHLINLLNSIVGDYKKFDSHHAPHYQVRFRIIKLYYKFIKWLLTQGYFRYVNQYFGDIRFLTFRLEKWCSDKKIKNKVLHINAKLEAKMRQNKLDEAKQLFNDCLIAPEDNNKKLESLKQSFRILRGAYDTFYNNSKLDHNEGQKLSLDLANYYSKFILWLYNESFYAEIIDYHNSFRNIENFDYCKIQDINNILRPYIEEATKKLYKQDTSQASTSSGSDRSKSILQIGYEKSSLRIKEIFNALLVCKVLDNQSLYDELENTFDLLVKNYSNLKPYYKDENLQELTAELANYYYKFIIWLYNKSFYAEIIDYHNSFRNIENFDYCKIQEINNILRPYIEEATKKLYKQDTSQASTSSGSDRSKSILQIEYEKHSLIIKKIFNEFLARKVLDNQSLYNDLKNTFDLLVKNYSNLKPYYKDEDLQELTAELANYYYKFIIWLYNKSFYAEIIDYHNSFRNIENFDYYKIQEINNILHPYIEEATKKLYKQDTSQTSTSSRSDRSKSILQIGYEESSLRIKKIFNGLLVCKVLDNQSLYNELENTFDLLTKNYSNLKSYYKDEDLQELTAELANYYYKFIIWLTDNLFLSAAKKYCNELVKLNDFHYQPITEMKRNAYQYLHKQQKQHPFTTKGPTSSSHPEQSTSNSQSSKLPHIKKAQIMALLADNFSDLNIDSARCLHSFKYYCTNYKKDHDFDFIDIENCTYLDGSTIKKNIENFLDKNRIDRARNPIKTNYDLLNLISLAKNCSPAQKSTQKDLFNYLKNPNNYTDFSYKKHFSAIGLATSAIVGACAVAIGLKGDFIGENNNFLYKLLGITSIISLTGFTAYYDSTHKNQQRFESYPNYKKITSLSQSWIKNNS